MRLPPTTLLEVADPRPPDPRIDQMDGPPAAGAWRPAVRGGGPRLWYVVVHAHDFARDANRAVPVCVGHVRTI
jgi:hypothetical protein